MGQTAHRRSYLLAHICFLTVNVSAYQSNHGKDKNSKYMFSVVIQIDYPGTTIETSYIFFSRKTISCHDILHVSVILYLFSYQYSLKT